MTEGVWAVVFSNYYPQEVAALYDNEDAARAHANDEPDDWRAVWLPVGSTYEPGGDES